MFYAHSPDTLRDLRVPQSIVARLPQVQVVTSLVDMQVYVFRWVCLVEMQVYVFRWVGSQ